MANLIAVMK